MSSEKIAELFRLIAPQTGLKLDDLALPAIVTFRDRDPWYRASNSGHNKFGFLGKDGTVIYPFGRGVRRTSYSKICRHEHHIFAFAFASYHDQIDSFFRHNRSNADLFDIGMQKLLHGEFSYFDHSVKLPMLTPLGPEEFESRWAQLHSILQLADLIFTFDSSSFISCLIAHVDRGAWSHVAAYIGEGHICEAITSGVVERPLDVYHSPNFRLGVYRATSVDAEKMIAFSRAQLGKRYNYRGVLRLGALKLLGIRSKRVEPRNTSPNDLAIHLEPVFFV